MVKEVKQLKIDEPTEDIPEISDIGKFKPDVLQIGLAQYEEGHAFWSPIYAVASRDKAFLQSKQWDEKTVRAREKAGKVSATAPIIAAYFREKMGQLLPGSVDIKVVNVDPRSMDGVDVENQAKNDEAAGRIIGGAIQFVNRNSNAVAHRLRARKEQCSGGIGWLEVGFKDSPGVSNGETVVNSPRKTSSIIIDPYCENPDYSDAGYSFKIFTMSWAELKRKYPEAAKVRERDVAQSAKTEETAGIFTPMHSASELHDYMSTLDARLTRHCKNWIDEERNCVTVAVWYRRVDVDLIYRKLEDGRELPPDAWDALKEQHRDAGIDMPDVVDERAEIGWKVERRVITSWTVLEEDLDYFIDEVPHTPVMGYHTVNDDETTMHSIVHDGVELQEHINLLKSQAIEKAAKSKATGIVPHGVAADKIQRIASINNIDFYGVDPTAGGVWQDKNSGIQLLQNPDNGTAELAQIPIHLEMLKQAVGINDDGSRGNINSAAQLQLALEQELVIFHELDENYKMALTAHYRKVKQGILNTSTPEGLIRTIDQASDEERIVAEKIPGDAAISKYDLDLSITPSGQIQKRNEQTFLNAMADPTDPVLRNAVIPDLINTSPVRHKERTINGWARGMIVSGQGDALDANLRQKVTQEMQEAGELAELIQNQAQQIAEGLVQQQMQALVQEPQAQAILAESQAKIAAAQAKETIAVASVGNASVKAERDSREAELQVLEQQEQTNQEQLRNERARIDLQKAIVALNVAIANADAKGIELAGKQIEQFNSIVNGVSFQPQI